MVFYSEPDAVAAVEAMGGQPREDANGQYWVVRGKVDDWYGGYEMPAIVKVVHRKVDPQYKSPDYYEIVFN